MDLRSWVSDNTIKFLGAAHSTVVDYIIAEAQSAKSPDVLFNKLAGVGFPSGGEGRDFAESLYVKVPRQRKHTVSVQKKVKEKETSAFIQQNSSYKLLLDPEEETTAQTAPVQKEKKEKKEKKSKTRKREDGEDQWASDEEDKRVRKRRREDYEEEQRAKYDAQFDEEEHEEMKRQDEKERDEFAEKMKAKDKAAQQKVLPAWTSSAYTQILEDRSLGNRNQRRIAEDPVARAKELSTLRVESRESYLIKRQQQQIELLKQQVADDEVLWRNERLTKREMEEIKQRQEALRIALERQNIDDGFDGYAMPDEYFTKQGKIDKKRREEALTKRYHEPKNEKYTTDGDQWEALQTKLATSQLVPANKASRVDDYDYVFDEAQNVPFVMDSTMPGATSAEQRQLELKIKEAEQRVASIDAVRKGLPVYAFRDELLSAINDHQDPGKQHRSRSSSTKRDTQKMAK
jgi:pre-mRNA-splicing factor ATP-dependent RNA helicase DHX16